MRLSQALLTLTLCISSTMYAQSTEEGIAARLFNKPLYLRGSYHEDNLHFDAAGKLLSTSTPLAFTLCGVDIWKVQLQPDKLILEGKRVGIEFVGDVPKRVQLKGSGFSIKGESIHIEIDGAQDFGPALNAIFANGLADLAPSLPDYWQPYAHKHFLVPVDTAPPLKPKPKPDKSAGAITAPILIKSAEAQWSQPAHVLRYSGSSLINFVIAKDSSLQDFSIVRPIGMGLDEQAIAAVNQYVFQPAVQNGDPIAVEINIEVHFRD
jgi:TonB family protein